MSTPRVSLNQVNLVVGDMQRSVDFYRRLGLRIEDGDPRWNRDHRNAEGAEGGASFDLDSLPFAGQWGRVKRPGLVLGFQVATREDVDRIYAELTAAGHTGQQPPYDAFWGSRYAIVCDPDGNLVGLMSPPDEAHRKPQPPA
jgi:catechol 2,3-dioxygenase-like lactoylglutathione lyase family enzyme